jgi:nitrilase
MPLMRNAIYEHGVQILATPTWDKSPAWLMTTQSNAREGGMFIISCCMALKMDDIPDTFDFKKLYPEGREWINTGNSCIVGPNGKIIAGPMEAEKGILIADIDLRDIIAAKRMFDVVGNYARPDVFNFLVNR